MNVGISTACFYPDTPENGLDIIGKLGVKNVELFLNTEYEFSKEYSYILKEKLEYYSINLTSIHPYTGALEGLLFFSDYQRRTNDAYKQYERYFEFLNFLGGKFLTFHGERQGLMSFDDGKVLRDIEVYKNLCSIAKSKNVFLAQENVSYCNSADPNFLSNLYSNVDNLVYTFDVKQAARAKTSPFLYLDAMKDRIANIHANDYDENNTCKLPGTGILDMDRFLSTLKNYGYTGDFIIEVYRTNFKNEDELVKSYDFLKSVLKI